MTTLLSPEVAIAVASLSLVGTLTTALVLARNARKLNATSTEIQQRQLAYDSEKEAAEKAHALVLASDREAHETALAAAQRQHQASIQELSHDHDENLKALEHKHEDVLQAFKNDHEEKLQNLRQEHDKRMQEFVQQNAKDFELFKMDMQNELSVKRLQAIVNEANWRRVHDQVVSLSAVGFEMIDKFKAACDGASMSDEDIFSVAADAIKLHGQFKPLLRESRTGFRQEDYREISDFHRHLVKVFLDVAGDQAERKGKARTMEAHKRNIEQSEAHFRRIVDVFLQPQGQGWARRPGFNRSARMPDSTVTPPPVG